MNTIQLIQQLQSYQALVLNLCLQLKNEYRQQYHPDLSPAGWHLGHCVYTEFYWIREMFLENDTCDDVLTQLYNPLLSGKTERGISLPDLKQLGNWAKKIQIENIALLEKHFDHHNTSGLMQNNFLLYFLIQHYAQHYETIQMTRTQSILRNCNGRTTAKPLQSSPLDRSEITLTAGSYPIGANGHRLPYDNEYPGHETDIDDIHISAHPVTNAEFLAFMEQGGYENREVWSTPGWTWRIQNEITCPEYWQQDDVGNWYGINHQGRQNLVATSPVYGISHYEAEAFANWAGARLPHEKEWEAAFNAGILKNTGLVWEWCSNTFFPYTGFESYPYDGYSVPYFDGKHYTLKGGSILTQPVIKRPSFRNYYIAETRFVYAGMRLVFT